MQNFDIVRTSTVPNTFRNKAVIGMFDLPDGVQNERFVGSMDLPPNWKIGCIVGNSGTGKTTIAKHLFPNECVTEFKFDDKKSVLDCMPKPLTVQQITETFNAVGFSSPPSWLKPYSVLSNGQKMRTDLAFALMQDKPTIVFDEFTSVVDRTVAQVGSLAVQKAIRRTSRKFVAVTCHFDVIPWLMPDWVFDTNDMTFHVIGEKKNPKLESKYSRQRISQFGVCLQNTTI